MTDNKNQVGFTLIELLVVFAIIGLLSGMLVTLVNQTRVKARDGRRKTDLIQMQKALEIYNINVGSYPKTGTPGNLSWYGATNCGGTFGYTYTDPGGDYIPGLTPNYLQILPADPKPSTNVCSGYLYKSDGVNYKLISNNSSGVGGPESFPNSTEQFYDNCGPTSRWMVTNNQSVTNTPGCSGW